jgi:uncharacterized protein (DUF1778 family)
MTRREAAVMPEGKTMTTHTAASVERTARLNMRISPEALELVREAAAAQQQDVTSFVLGAAMERSRTVLMEQRVMVLTAREAVQVAESLDREARVIPELAALIHEVKQRRVNAQSPATARA